MTASAQIAFLAEFEANHHVQSKGSLSMVLALTRRLSEATFPVDHRLFETEKQGQVRGMGGAVVRKILREHGINRTLSEEGGRTSRGSMERMRSYIAGLNILHADGHLDLVAAEIYWIRRVEAFFASKPFTFRLDPSKSLRFCLRNLIAQASERQKAKAGTMYVGAVMQHLVGAKLRLISGVPIESHGFSVADAPSNRSGDFLIGDVSIHVTNTPGEALLRKCVNNLSTGLKPLIVTSEDGIGGARAFSKQAGIEDRIDVIEIEQFLAANLYEHSNFERAARSEAVRALMSCYNDIVSECETDPSLRIDFDG